MVEESDGEEEELAAATATASSAALASSSKLAATQQQQQQRQHEHGLEAVAESERLAGNEHFKVGKLVEAAVCYSRSLEASPSSTAFANRALVRLRLAQFVEAEVDCSAALALEPG